MKRKVFIANEQQVYFVKGEWYSTVNLGWVINFYFSILYGCNLSTLLKRRERFK